MINRNSYFGMEKLESSLSNPCVSSKFEQNCLKTQGQPQGGASGAVAQGARCLGIFLSAKFSLHPQRGFFPCTYRVRFRLRHLL